MTRSCRYSGSPPLHDLGWLYEPKFDGWRGTLYLDGHSTYIRSKRGNVLRRFGELAGRVRAELGVRDAILDGEVVALDDDGQMSFNALERVDADGMSEEITTPLARGSWPRLADARVLTLPPGDQMAYV